MVAEADTSSQNAEPAPLWDRLREAVDLNACRPCLRERIAWKELTTTHGEKYVIIQNPDTATYLRLPSEDFYVFQLMDGSRTVQQIVVEYMLKFNRFALQHIIELVQDLRYGEFLTDRPYYTYRQVRQLARRRSFGAIVDDVLKLYLNREFPIKGVDDVFNKLYRGGAWLLLTLPGLILLAAIALLGVPLLGWDLHTAHISLTDRDFLARYALLGYLSLLAIAIIHELGHAFSVKSYGRVVRGGGIGLFYGSPCLYVDTQDMWMAPRRARIAASWAGPYSGFILAGLAGLALTFLPHGGWMTFARAFGITALVENAFQLNPFIQYDGYYILMDWLDIYNLRRRALTFIRFDLRRKLWRREHFNREERIFAVFGVIAASYTVFAIFLVLTFGWDHARDAIQSAVRVHSLQSFLLVALLALILIPFAIGVVGRLIGLACALLRAAGRATGAARERWYHERVVLLSQVPSLARLGDERIHALAPHLREERQPAGAAIVRQGERGDRFYLIVDGRAGVFAENGDGSSLVAELGPMDYFGERALLEHAPRAATVRAKTKVRLLSLRAREFQTSIRQYIAMDAALRARLDELAEMDRFPLLQPLGPRDREILLGCLRPVSYVADQTIVSEGEPGEEFYLLRSGTVRVSRREAGGQEIGLQILGPGDFFGEIALLLDSPRVASVRAREQTEVWALSRRDFSDLVGKYFSLDEHMAPVVRERLAADQIIVFEDEIAPALGPGAYAPELELESFTGTTVKASDYRGRRLLLWFSPGFSSPASLEYLARIHAALPGLAEHNTSVVLIDPHRAEPVQGEVQDDPDVPILHDPNKSAYLSFGMYQRIDAPAAESGVAWQATMSRSLQEQEGPRSLGAIREGVVVIGPDGLIERICPRDSDSGLPAPAQLLGIGPS
ncbi:MAG TPA: cyclic nucleotide-binding domain-containing protein [Dehalococcoidia bacterium]|nr:cyclic nucleotide-binding domain-containing protein [Dehalococcoidia bacterium]